VVLDRSEPRDLCEAVRRELEHVRHDAEVHSQRFQRSVRIFAAQRFELVDLEPLFLRRRAQRIGLGTGFFRRAKHASDFVAALEEFVQHVLAEVLLTDDRYFHV
jgi:hypothetical protein